jgi:hypothetical protein
MTEGDLLVVGAVADVELVDKLVDLVVIVEVEERVVVHSGVEPVGLSVGAVVVAETGIVIWTV